MELLGPGSGGEVVLEFRLQEAFLSADTSACG